MLLYQAFFVNLSYYIRRILHWCNGKYLVLRFSLSISKSLVSLNLLYVKMSVFMKAFHQYSTENQAGILGDDLCRSCLLCLIFNKILLFKLGIALWER